MFDNDKLIEEGYYFDGEYLGKNIAKFERKVSEENKKLSALESHETMSIELATSGTLESKIKESEKLFVKHLTLTGSIDARDINFLSNELHNLYSLDISGVTIKSYKGKGGTEHERSIEYEANMLPINTLLGHANIQSIILPNSMSKIGEGAFDRCSINEFVVLSENSNFKSVNGILFSKDTTTLIKYPSGRNDATYKIPNFVIKIGTDAFNNDKLQTVIIHENIKYISGFSGCRNLKSVFFMGKKPDNIEVEPFAFVRTKVCVPYKCSQFFSSSLIWNRYKIEEWLTKEEEVEYNQEMAENQLLKDEKPNLRNFIKLYPKSSQLHKISNSIYYFGEWDTKSTMASGKGVMLKMKSVDNPNTDDYFIGNFSNGLLNDPTGKILLDCGVELFYTGNVSNNMPHGQGKGEGNYITDKYFLKEKNVVYSGSWNEGNISGSGVFEGKETLIDGIFKNGKLDGECNIWLQKNRGILTPYYLGAVGNWKMGYPYGHFIVKSKNMGNYYEKNIEVNTLNDLKECMLQLARKGDSDWDATVKKQKQEECANCIIDVLKTTFPEENETWFLKLTYQKPGVIQMKNGQKYEFYFNNEKHLWYINSGFSGESFKTFDLLLDRLMSECKKRYCN